MENINRELALLGRNISRVLGDHNIPNLSVSSGYILISDKIIIDCSHPAADILGYEPVDLIGKSIDDFLYPLSEEFKGKDLINYIDLNGKGRSMKFDWKVKTREGQAVECELSIFPLKDHHIIFINQPNHQISNWVHEFESLSSHDQQFSTQAVVLFRMSNERNQFYYFSKQWLKFTGKKLKDELNEGWIHHVHPSDHDRVLSSIQEAFKKLLKYEISYRLLRHDGESRLIFESGIPLFDTDGNFIGYLAVSVDSTSVRDVEKETPFNDSTFKALAENAPVLFKMADEHGNYYYFSKQWVSFSGRSIKEESRGGWMKHIHREDYKMMLETLDKALTTKRKYEVVYRVKNKDDEYRWVLDIGIPIFSHAGSFTGYISASIDITENKLVEERKSRQNAFRESEKKLQSSFDNSNLIALSVNQEGKIVYCNRYFLELTGLEPAEVIGNDFYRFFEISPESNTGNISLERYFAEPGYSSGFEAYTKSSFREKFIIRFSSVIFFGDIDQPAAFTLVGENITERKKVREALEQSNSQLKDFLDNANDLIQIFTPDGRLLFVNKIWKSKLGYSDEEIPTIRSQSVIHPEYRASTAKIFADLAAGKGTPFLETEYVTKSGRRIHLAGSVNCSFKDGIVKEYRAILYDITERVRAEKAQNLYHKIANLTIQSSDLDSFFRSIHAELDRIMFAKNFFVALLDASGAKLTYPYIVDENLGPDPTNFQRELSNGISEYILLTKKSHQFVESDLRQMELDRTVTMTGKIPRACLGAPLKLQERIIGVICVQNYSDPDIYSEKDLEILKFLSGQIALSIERKRNESKIREQAARQQAIFESTSHLIWSVNRSYHITSSNRNYDEFIQDFIPVRQKDEKDHAHDHKLSEVDFWKSRYDVAFGGKGLQFESKFININNNSSVWKDIVLHPIINDSGKVEEISCIAHDITAKKTSEFALRESEEKFRDIFESFQDLYFRCDFKGNILMLSPSIKEVLGYEPKEMAGKNITNFYLYTKKTKDLLRQLTRRKSVRNFEASVVAKNGSIMQCICNIRLVYDNNFKAVAMEGVARDITQIKETHKELKQAKDLAEKSLKVKESFLANMSHEIRTPMNGIIGMIDLLEGTVITGKQKNYIHTIKKSSETLLNILNDILDLSKIEAGKMQLRKHPVRLKNLMEKLIALFSHQAASRNIRFKYHISEKLPEYLMIDETRLLQILSNLTSNAIKFTEGGGSIDINLKKTKVLGKKNMIRCSVSDSGIGISPENLKKLFTSFSQLDTSTTKTFSGTGLGLAISKQLCKLMGGKISVYSTLGSGSTFWFTFQAEPSRKTMVVDNKFYDIDIQIDGYFEKERPSILLVDDNLVNRQVAGEILKKSGCRVILAETGRDAIELVKKNKFDLIFMDIQMPDMDGVTATRKIKSLKLSGLPPIIAMTAYSMKEDKEKFIAQGLDDYIAKPIRAVELVNKVRQWIRDEKAPLAEAEHITQTETINFSVINQLGNLGGEEMIENVLSEFLAESSELLKNCMEARDGRDYREILKHLHTLKGNSGTLGIDKLSSIAANIEVKLSNQRYETLEDDLNYLNLAFGEFVTEYHELIKSKKNAAI